MYYISVQARNHRVLCLRTYAGEEVDFSSDHPASPCPGDYHHLFLPRMQGYHSKMMPDPRDYHCFLYSRKWYPLPSPGRGWCGADLNRTLGEGFFSVNEFFLVLHHYRQIVEPDLSLSFSYKNNYDKKCVCMLRYSVQYCMMVFPCAIQRDLKRRMHT